MTAMVPVPLENRPGKAKSAISDAATSNARRMIVTVLSR